MSEHRAMAPWFNSLPHDMKAEFRKRWAAEAQRKRWRVRFGVLGIFHCVWRGALVFGLADAVFMMPSQERLMFAVAAGAVIGLLWGVTSSGGMRSMVIAVPAYVAFTVAFEDKATLTLFAVVFAVLLVAGLSIGAGLIREWRRADGQEN